MVVGAAATQSGGGDLRGSDDDLVLPVSQHAAPQWHSLHYPLSAYLVAAAALLALTAAD